MKNYILYTIVFSTSLIFSSCKKYENGGLKSRAEKNIKKTWVIDAYLLNGTDKTSSLLISNFSETFSDNDSYSRKYNDASGDLKNESGTWTLKEEKSLINLSGPGSYELTAETSTVSASNYTIIKLKKDELWYYFENGGNKHEFHMKPQ